ncbi:sugar efflux transporter [Pseudomonas extremaustralis]|uniref:Sugar efflux transporter n=2 Tax=Pseudomonas TaxID=286 RepID=A0A6L5BRP4_9PSED|nr:sugar efflux transporter [Pseudomonas marginalis]KAA8560944.1 sugar efflux transporter [Pseudomonas extremaustralis]KAF2390402.1 sugar efflux transporter [Pseudomonas frederiksbergensis]
MRRRRFTDKLECETTRLPYSDQRIITAFLRQAFHKRVQIALVRCQLVLQGERKFHLPQIANDLAITQGQAGLMITIPGVVAACSALLTIGLTNAFDRRHVIWVLLSLLVVSNSLTRVAVSRLRTCRCKLSLARAPITMVQAWPWRQLPDEALQELELDVGESLYLIEEFVGNTRCLVLSKKPSNRRVH